MSRHLFALPIMALLCLGILSCNKSDDEEVEPINYTNTAITSFALAEDDEVLRDLSTVFFSIDLVNAQVFNADSLPKGTNVSALAVNIGTSVLSKAEITYYDNNGVPQTADYLADNSVKINFANGPASLKVTSYDGTTTRTYTIKVNVHQLDADLLCWDEAATATLPTTLPMPLTAARTTEWQGRQAVLTVNATDACLAVATDLDHGDWSYQGMTLPAGADIATFTGGDSGLYIVAGDMLWTSTDGSAWTSTGEPMTWIYGVYDGTVLGNLRNADGTYDHVTWPGGTGAAVDGDCPVSGTSRMLGYVNDWMAAPVAVMAGGVKADGSLSGDTWGYDGSEWARISSSPLPGATGMTLVPYFVYRTSSTSWLTTKLTAFLAMGGTTSDGSLTRTVYLSTDYGIHWAKASDALQLPDDIPSFSGADALVYTKTLYPTRDSGGAWTPSDGSRLPAWMTSAASRATEGVSPIEEWECPYIYLSGGVLEDGSVNNRMWRGVINRLTFKPLQ